MLLVTELTEFMIHLLLNDRKLKRTRQLFCVLKLYRNDYGEEDDDDDDDNTQQ